MYNPLLLDHFQNPRNVGELPPPAVTVEVTNPVCGDILRLSVLLQHSAISEARYKTRGCTASIAAGSALTVLLSGKPLSELRNLKPSEIEAAVGGLSAESKHAAALCMDAVRALLQTVSIC